MRYIDRKAELARLRTLARTPEGGLAVIWGRRRVGKTRLLLEWLRGGRGLYWVADASAAPIQRKCFAHAMEARFPGFGQVDYPDWDSLLSRLAREAGHAAWRGPLVFDEMPYLVESASELPSVLQKFVDHAARDARLVLALAGSSRHMMQGLALDSDAPLYGRAREILKLEPIPAGYLGDALGLRGAGRIVEAYALWGGIPRYWEMAAPFRDSRQAVDSLVLDPLGALHDEPNRLLLEETPPASALRPVLDAIGAGSHRVSEIAGRLAQPATSLARPLARLQELDLVTREIPFGEPERSGKRALYRLSDPFLRLWFGLVAPNRSLLAQAPASARLALFDQVFPRLRSLAWEELCRRSLPRLSFGKTRFGPARRFWHGTDPEWDMVAETEDGRGLFLGEAQWTEREPTGIQALLSKGVSPRFRGREIHYGLFLPRVPKGKRSDPPNVHWIGASDVVAALR